MAEHILHQEVQQQPQSSQIIPNSAEKADSQNDLTEQTRQDRQEISDLIDNSIFEGRDIKIDNPADNSKFIEDRSFLTLQKIQEFKQQKQNGSQYSTSSSVKNQMTEENQFSMQKQPSQSNGKKIKLTPTPKFKQLQIVLQQNWKVLKYQSETDLEYFKNYTVQYNSTRGFREGKKLPPIHRNFFSMVSMNLAFPGLNKRGRQNVKNQDSKFIQTSFQKRVTQIIELLHVQKQLRTDFIFLQEFGDRKMKDALKIALKKTDLGYYYADTLYTHQSEFSTFILSRYPVRFGSFGFNFSVPIYKSTQENDPVEGLCNSTNVFCQLDVVKNGEKKTLMFMSNHFRSDKNKKYATEIRQSQALCIKDFTKKYDYSFIIGDCNIGSTDKYERQNQFIQQVFVDALDLKCNLEVEKDDMTTYIFRDLVHESKTGRAKLCYERFDRFLVTNKAGNLEKAKSQIMVKIQVWDQPLQSCQNLRCSPEQVMLREKYSRFMNVSDHSFLNIKLGFCK